jgi:hypothetical protein
MSGTSDQKDPTARLNTDGSVTIVVAARDPGVGNWLDTAGHREGFILFRSYAAKHNPLPDCRVVKLSDVKKAVAAVS